MFNDKNLIKQMRRFLLTGGLAVLTDLLFYYILINFIWVALAKAISFIIGAIVAFLLGKYYTFEQPKTGIKKETFRFTLLYATTFMLNVASNQLALWVFPAWVFFAFIFATAVSTICNFIGQKFFVFRK